MSEERDAPDADLDAAAAAPDSAPGASPRFTSPREALAIAAAVTLASGLVTTYAFDPRRDGTSATVLAFGLLYALLGAFTLRRFDRRRELGIRLRPAGGDFALGALVAGALYGLAHIVEQTVATHGSIREAWIMRVYLQVGDPEAPGRAALSGVVFVVGVLEELVWRGLVMRSLEEAYASRRALVLTSLLYGLANAPTLFLLGDPSAGLNPLIVIAAVGCGTIWGLVYLRTRRLVPALFAHALFSWAIYEFPLWRP
jgi:uncharacterized protein